MATEYRINPRYSGKKRVRIVNENGDLVDLVADKDYEIEVAETKKKAAYKLTVKKATKEDMAYHHAKGKQKLIQKLVNGKVTAWDAEEATDTVPAAIASTTVKTGKSDKSNGQ